MFSLVFLVFLLPLFFYNLGESSLVPFDEAWYAAVAREILKSGNLINLSFNGQPFLDHPPAGYWFMALSLKTWGMNEFGARFAPALAGFLSLVVLYFLGKKLFNPLVGLVSALALASSPWFLFRARSGNLEAILVFFFLLTIFLALKSVEEKKFLFPFAVSLVLLLLTKTMVPLAIFPTLAVIFWRKRTAGELLPSILMVVLVFGGWFSYQILNHQDFLERFVFIGFPGVSLRLSLGNLALFKTYLHSGIGKWFWPGVLSHFAGIFTKERRFLILSTFFVSFSLPFLFSHKVQVWHLVPLHPVLTLAFFGFFYVFLTRLKVNNYLVVLLIVLSAAYLFNEQTLRNWHEFINIPPSVSAEEILGREAAKYGEPLFLEGDTLQSVVFYSDKRVETVTREGLGAFFEKKGEALLIVHQWLLEDEKIAKNSYTIVKEEKDLALIKKE